MNRYRTARRASSPHAKPIVAFLLIACFGLLFVSGCGGVRGPDAAQVQDETFTAEDVARFRELADADRNTGSGAAVSSDTLPTGILRTATGSVPAAADPALQKANDALRAMSAGKGNVYRVTNEFLNVRSEPRVSAASVGRLVQGDIVSVIDFTDANWAKVAVTGGQEGYVSLRYIAKLTTEERLKEEQKQFEGLYFVNFAFLNVRQAPDTQSDKLGEIPGQAFVRPLSMEKDWARVVFGGKEGYVSTQFLSPFQPAFLVRQERYQLPILLYRVDQQGIPEALAQHVARLKQEGIRILTFRDLRETVLTQEVRDVRIPPRSVLLAVTGITAENVRAVSDALAAADVPATLFLQGDRVGLSGVTEKMLLTLQANGFDLQSAGHTGDDLRSLTPPQTQLELGQSRMLLEGVTQSSVFAVAYPQGGANERVQQQAAEAGYLFGLGSVPGKTFTREEFLRLPSFSVSPGMTPDDILTVIE